MLKIVFLISALVGLSSGQLLPKPGVCGIVPATSSLITYGNKTKIGEYPWTVLFLHEAQNERQCGGSLINDRYVVTAAHCVKKMDLKPYVRLGEWDTRTNPDCEQNEHNETLCAPDHVEEPVQDIIVHPQYKIHYRNYTGNETFLVKLIYDIALLRLAHPVNFTKFVSPICLPLEPELSSASFEGLEMDVVGWGKTEHNKTSPVKLKATVKVINLGECKKRRKYLPFDDSAICARGFKGVNSCGGDSGGPLVGIHKTNANSSHYFLAGVASAAPKSCTKEGSPGTYTRVGKYIDWIKENIKP